MDGNDSVSEASNTPPPTSSPEISEPEIDGEVDPSTSSREPESDGEAGPSTSSREPESDGEAGPSTSSRPHRQRTLPSCFRHDSMTTMMDQSVCYVIVMSLKVLLQIQSSGLTVTNVGAGFIISALLEATQPLSGFCAQSVPNKQYTFFIIKLIFLFLKIILKLLKFIKV